MPSAKVAARGSEGSEQCLICAASKVRRLNERAVQMHRFGLARQARCAQTIQRAGSRRPSKRNSRAKAIWLAAKAAKPLFHPAGLFVLYRPGSLPVLHSGDRNDGARCALIRSWTLRLSTKLSFSSINRISNNSGFLVTAAWRCVRMAGN